MDDERTSQFPASRGDIRDTALTSLMRVVETDRRRLMTRQSLLRCAFGVCPRRPGDRCRRVGATTSGRRRRSGRRRGARPRRPASRACRRRASAARRRPVCVRHRRAAQDPRRRRDQGAREALEPRVSPGWQHARHGAASGPASDHPQRRARSEADRRRAEVAAAWARRADGCRASSALRREQADLPHLQQTRRRRQDRDDARARPVGRRGARPTSAICSWRSRTGTDREAAPRASPSAGMARCS